MTMATEKQLKTLKTLTAQRQTELLKITELKSAADKALVDSKAHNMFYCRFQHIENIKGNFDDVQSNIISIASLLENAADLDSHNKILLEFESMYYHCTATYRQIFADNSPSATNNDSGASYKKQIKLPEIELMHFDGNPRHWQTYIDMFDSMIHDNESIAPIDKFNYLISSLKGPALSLVRSKPLTGQNYIVAYNALKKRFDNRRAIATSHWRALVDAKRIQANNFTSLRLLLDCFDENISILRNFNLPVDQWDFILFNMLLDKLDAATATAFQVAHGSNFIQDNSYETLYNFLQSRCQALDTVSNTFCDNVKVNPQPKLNQTASHKNKFRTSSFVASTKAGCQICKQDHLIYNCPIFLQKTPNERYAFVKANKFCTNCLGTRHNVKNCSSSSLCRKCSKAHHTLLHFESNSHNPNSSSNELVQASARDNPNPFAALPANGQIGLVTSVNSTVLLPTVLVEVLDSTGQYQRVRAILDSASQSNFITEECCKRLKLKQNSSIIEIFGIASLASRSSSETSCSLKPLNKLSPIITSTFLVLPQICTNIPSVSISPNYFSQCNIDFADPSFFASSPIDLLLGAEIFSSVLSGKSMAFQNNDLVALETVFGWIVMGKLTFESHKITHSFLVSTDLALENSVQRFWELEQIPSKNVSSADDELAETIFKSTTTRNPDGRYIVDLPFQISHPTFEGSRDVALKQFFALERRLLKNPELYSKYSEFMSDYLNSGHMELVTDVSPSSSHFFIPHHCIMKSDIHGKKIRVVFNASMKSHNSLSLNDVLLVGPKLQQDIASILLRYRLFRYAFSCDIKQMFRQILISDAHKDFQRIFWRFSKEDPVSEFRLNTVTYGVKSSPFLANRTIIQIADDYSSQYPLASHFLKTMCYIDDIFVSTDTLDEARRIQDELIKLLGAGGFELRKWISNHPSLISHFPSSHLQNIPLSMDLEDSIPIKILGLRWNPSFDTFSFDVQYLDRSCTKRILLSEMSRIFDPLGFLTPISLTLKILVQKLWSLGIGWDDPVPESILCSWLKIRAELSLLSSINIPRHIDLLNVVELHGFCDASLNGYAAVCYFRSISSSGIRTYFICSRSRVSPLKTISIPRLELCSALLLSHLIEFIQQTYAGIVSVSKIFAWTDSTISLCWIKSSPHKWTTFVSNRVSQIQERIAPACWHHVRSELNPADPASRGLLPSELCQNSLWWLGPSFLLLPEESWPISKKDECSDLSPCLEEQRKLVLTSSSETNVILSLIDRFSSLPKIQRTLAYVLRFIKNCRSPNSKNSEPFNSFDMEHSLHSFIRMIQAQCFDREISLLKSNKLLPKMFRKLNPFLDDEGTLRVGGRIANSSLNFEQKHPILLPGNHRLTLLIIEHVHKSHSHPGPQTLQYILAQKYWIFSFKRIIKGVTSRCRQCFLSNPKSPQPIMGNLPAARISQVKPFSHVGIDFGGPFSITQGRFRGAKVYKGYLCLFICMATKAVHLELTTGLSTETFLAALRRFLSRRGRCNHIYSDCGTNFVGASKEILSHLQDAVTSELIQWHFNPPNAPNFGGLWEAGIKSVKTHIKRVVGNQVLSFEEFYTVLTQIEALLNSRPLCPLNDDPADVSSILCPGMFLNLEPVHSLPDPNLGHIKIGRLSRWQLVQSLQQHFWHKWRSEYLHTLIQRGKWTNPSTPIKIGTMVLLTDESTSPFHWPLGRITEIFPGKDKIVRVVNVKTIKGSYKRPVTKVCPLPYVD